MPPPDPNASVISVIRLFARIAGALLATIIALLGVIYWGIDARLKTIEGRFDTAIGASANVKHLLDTAPTLEQQITETRIDVKGLKDSMDLLNPRETHDAIIALKPVPEQLKEVKKQLDNSRL
jgi:hypothetical protein